MRELGMVQCDLSWDLKREELEVGEVTLMAALSSYI